MTQKRGEKKYHYAITQDDDGEVVAHRHDCPEARSLAGRGEPVMTMYDCGGPLPDHVKKHSCLRDERK